MTVDEARREARLRKLGALVLWAVSILALVAIVAKSLDVYGQYHMPPLAAVWP